MNRNQPNLAIAIFQPELVEIALPEINQNYIPPRKDLARVKNQVAVTAGTAPIEICMQAPISS